jgi:hypothetical protein
MELDSDAIRALLPHRSPLLLARALEVRTPGESGVGRIALDPDTRLWGDWCVRDLVQELILEGAAQVFGLVLAAGRAADPGSDERHLLLGFGSVSFADTTDPGPELAIEVALVQRLGGMCRGRFSARGDAGELARGELTVMQG